MTAVSILATSTIGYGLAARECIKSVLRHTDFSVYVTCDSLCARFIPKSDRIQMNNIPEALNDAPAHRFLAKFLAISFCLKMADDEVIVQLDADAMIVRSLSTDQLQIALGDLNMGMAEQTQTIGHNMDRAAFLRHYTDVSLAFIAPDDRAPLLRDFRYFNSGVVVCRRQELQDFLNWANAKIDQRPDQSAVGNNMIADQDYFQVWANTIRPGTCAVMDWPLNHCELWDEGFPRADAQVVHFSNFCNGPDLKTIAKMSRLRDTAGGGAPDSAQKCAAKSDTVTFIVVTFNSEDTIEICLDELTTRECSFLIVDNHSTDATRERIERYKDCVYPQDRNHGFATAANLGARKANSEFVCFLNPDCMITDEFVKQVNHLVAKQAQGVFVPNFIHWDGQMVAGRQAGYTRLKLLGDVLASRGDTLLSRWIRTHTQIDDASWHWPLAACMLVNRNSFLEVGGFDERYFCYMEDVQLGAQAAKTGLNIVGLDCAVAHFGGQGSSVSDEKRRQLITQARMQYARVTYGTLFETALKLVLLTVGRVRKFSR